MNDTSFAAAQQNCQYRVAVEKWAPMLSHPALGAHDG